MSFSLIIPSLSLLINSLIIIVATTADFSRFPRYFIQNFLINRRSYDLSEIQEFLVVKRSEGAETASGTVSLDLWND